MEVVYRNQMTSVFHKTVDEITVTWVMETLSDRFNIEKLCTPLKQLYNLLTAPVKRIYKISAIPKI